LTNREASAAVPSLYADAEMLQRFLIWGRHHIYRSNHFSIGCLRTFKSWTPRCRSRLWLLTLAPAGGSLAVSAATLMRLCSRPRAKRARLCSAAPPYRVTARLEQWPTQLIDVVSLKDVLHHIPTKTWQPRPGSSPPQTRGRGIFQSRTRKRFWPALARGSFTARFGVAPSMRMSYWS
jgi:hypothetical protein